MVTITKKRTNGLYKVGGAYNEIKSLEEKQVERDQKANTTTLKVLPVATIKETDKESQEKLKRFVNFQLN